MAELEHPKLYSRTSSSGKWVFNGKEYLFETVTTTYEFDKNLRDWVKTKVVTSTETPEQRGLKKKIDFLIVFPDPDSNQKQFGKSKKKLPKLFAQRGVVAVRDDEPYTYLLTEFQPAIEQKGASGTNKIFVRTLSGHGISYRFGYRSDEKVMCSIDDEETITLAQLKECESQGLVILYHARAEWSESEGFTYANVALNA